MKPEAEIRRQGAKMLNEGAPDGAKTQFPA